MTGHPPVLMYTRPTCSYCARARALLREKGVGYREIDISGNEQLREEMIQRSGLRTVPQIFIGDHHVGGFDDLSALERSGKLDPLLNGGS